MSVDFEVSLVVGVPLIAIYREEETVENRTKYDPDTGQPKTVAVKVLKRWVGDKELPSLEAGTGRASYREFRRDWNFLEGVEPFFAGYSADSSRDVHGAVVGIQVGESNSIGDLNGMKVEDMMLVVKKAKDALEKYGYNGEVEVYTFMQAG